jgi:hypothetical protein
VNWVGEWLLSMFCVFWSRCAKYLTGLFLGIYDGCPWKKFREGKDETASNLTKEIKSECKNKTSCSRTCAEAVEKMSKHPCLQGEIRDYIVARWRMSKEFKAYLEMCKDTVSTESFYTGANRSNSNRNYCFYTNIVILSMICLIRKLVLFTWKLIWRSTL